MDSKAESWGEAVNRTPLAGALLYKRRERVISLSINLLLFKVYVHADTVFFNRTGRELALGSKLADLDLWVRTFQEHGLKSPFC